MYQKIYPCGSKPATIYSLPKTHKILFDSDDFSLWPIIYFIGTCNYNLAKFLTELLAPVNPKEHCAQDSFSFWEEIQQISSNVNFLVSYDVCSLFTSIPLAETTEIAVELIFENNRQLKVMKRELKQFFNFPFLIFHKDICERFCKDIDINIAFSSLKRSSFFSCKGTLPKSLQSSVGYQFTCGECKACYIGETKSHLNTRIEKHLGKDKKFHIYLHL